MGDEGWGDRLASSEEYVILLVRVYIFARLWVIKHYTLGSRVRASVRVRRTKFAIKYYMSFLIVK